ncbi:snail [Haematobia irritans]|uniref:snail n=1 Tax=Haematobia irritans TaxID=7368 RepID=UPI003F5021E0
MATNYKSCPLKKRPIIYVKDEQELQQHQHVQVYEQMEALALTKTSKIVRPVSPVADDQPQDLSLKRKASDSFEDYVVPVKRECVLNLSSKSSELSHTFEKRPMSSSPVMDLSGSSAMLSPPAEIDSSMEYQPSDIHLRGLTANTSGYTTNPYQSAFVMAAGCNPMTALWNTYQPNISAIFPSPASSIASAASPRSNYSYQHITPPSSPGSEMVSEPEDLSVRNDIPLPALFHMFDESPSHSSFSSASSVYSHSSATSSSASSSSGSSSSSSTSSQNANKNYRFKCDKCNKMYSTSMGLSKHQQFHCPAAECNQEKKQHSCQDCGKLYTTMGALKMHIRTHTLPCKCPICGKAFSRPWLLQGHIRTHTGEKPFQCPDCPRSFADRSNLRAHQQTHVDVKKYACKVCNKSFSRMSLLNKHASSNCTITIA